LHPFALAEDFSSVNCQQTVIQCCSYLPYSYDENKKTFHSHGVKQRFGRRCGVVLDGKTYEHYARTSSSKLFIVSLMRAWNKFCWVQGTGHTFTEFWAESLLEC